MTLPVTADIVLLASPLRAPFTTASGTLRERRSFLFVLRDEDSGLIGIGEAAPLPGWTEDATACEAALRGARAAIRADAAWAHAAVRSTAVRSTAVRSTAVRSTAVRSTAVRSTAAARAPDDIADLDERFPQLAHCPAARCAVETALLDLEARRRGIPLQDHLAGAAAPRLLPVNAVIGSSNAGDTITAARAAMDAGYSCVKCKVGALPLEEDVGRVRALRSRAGAELRLRLDANGAWDEATALEAVMRLVPFDIEYIEQPVPRDAVQGLARLRARSPIPIAADESANSIDAARRLLSGNAADVFILKPMALGGLLRSRAFALRAMSAGKKCVFTSLIDFSPGRRAAAALAASIPGCDSWHHGLASGALLGRDIAPDDVRGGMMLLPDAAGLGTAWADVEGFADA